jgi:hypothetical protein
MLSLRHIAALLVLSLFVVRDLSRPIIAADYLVNLERYKQACINKSKPQTGCNGRCQMMRKMGAAEGAANSETIPPAKPFFGESVFDRVFIPTEMAFVSDESRQWSGIKSDDYVFSSMDDIFHPPSTNA